MRHFLLPAAALGFLFVACDHSSSGSATPSSSTTAVPSALPSASASAPAPSAGSASDAAPTYGLGDPPRLPDADIDGLEKGLKCNATLAAKPGPCKVLASMEKCAEWAAVAPSGDGRWIGHGFQVVGAATTSIVTVLRSHKVAQSEVKPWQLPIKIALGSIGSDAGPAFAQADRAINAYERHDVPPARNAAVDFLKQKSDWTDDAPAARTMGEMVETFSDHPTYICQGAGQQIELVRQASGDIGVKPDGLYAELWASSW